MALLKEAHAICFGLQMWKLKCRGELLKVTNANWQDCNQDPVLVFSGVPSCDLFTDFVLWTSSSLSSALLNF